MATKRLLTPTQIVLGSAPVPRIAKTVGITRYHLYKVISGERTPSLSVFSGLAAALGISLEKLRERLAHAQKGR